MVAMLETLAAQRRQKCVRNIYGTHDRQSHAMREHIRSIAAEHPAISVVDFHQTPLADEGPGEDCDYADIVIDTWLVEHTDIRTADYFLCGPRPFLRAAVSKLSQAGVPSHRIHHEFSVTQTSCWRPSRNRKTCGASVPHALYLLRTRRTT